MPSKGTINSGVWNVGGVMYHLHPTVEMCNPSPSSPPTSLQHSPTPHVGEEAAQMPELTHLLEPHPGLRPTAETSSRLASDLQSLPPPPPDTPTSLHFAELVLCDFAF